MLVAWALLFCVSVAVNFSLYIMSVTCCILAVTRSWGSVLVLFLLCSHCTWHGLTAVPRPLCAKSDLSLFLPVGRPFDLIDSHSDFVGTNPKDLHLSAAILVRLE